ncbi:MAG: hypothetical protein Q9195_007272 [Heterodermia aff. obscurata]
MALLAFIFFSLSLFHQYDASPVIQKRDNTQSGVPILLNTAVTGTGTGNAGVSSSVLPPYPTTGGTSGIAAGSGFLTTSANPTSIPGISEGTSSNSPSAPNSPVPVSGTWSLTATEPTVALPSYDPPSSTIAGAAATSEAVQLSGLFFAIYANRNHITESNFKQQYIDNVKKVKQETDSLFNSLKDKAIPDPDCSNLKRKRNAVTDRDLRLLASKRSIISGLTDLVKDAASLVSCASKVVDNLVKAVEDPLPSISKIENLTDTLNELGKDLKEEDNKPSGSNSVSQQSTTEDSFSDLIDIILLRNDRKLYRGKHHYRATATPTGEFICGIDCAACRDNPVEKRNNLLTQRDVLEQRSLGDVSWSDSKDTYVMEQLEEFPGVERLMHRVSGLRSSAMTRTFEKTPRRLYVDALYGCTSVVIISEMGVWFSHHWEQEQFRAPEATFQREVLGTIQNGDPASLVNMPAAFPLANGDGILNPKYNVRIYISTPKDADTGTELYETRVDMIVDLLTGPGKPWAGIEPVRRGYLKPRPNTLDEKNFEKRANGKILVEYDNNQEAEPDEEPKAKQQAIYRVWLEQQYWEHEWDAKPGIQAAASCENSNQKREDGGSCTTPNALGACAFSTSPGPFLSTMPILTSTPTPENPSITTTFAFTTITTQPSPTATAIDEGDDGGTGNPTFDAAGNAIGDVADAAGDVLGDLFGGGPFR